MYSDRGRLLNKVAALGGLAVLHWFMSSLLRMLLWADWVRVVCCMGHTEHSYVGFQPAYYGRVHLTVRVGRWTGRLSVIWSWLAFVRTRSLGKRAS